MSDEYEFKFHVNPASWTQTNGESFAEWELWDSGYFDGDYGWRISYYTDGLYIPANWCIIAAGGEQ